MMSELLLAKHVLDNGLEILFHDQGNRYFGDYHQVKVVVVCRIDLSDELESEYLSADDLHRARELFGGHIEYKRLLKQMGVAGADVETVKGAMVESFIENSATYMQVENFASRFVARKLTEHRNRSHMHVAGYD